MYVFKSARKFLIFQIAVILNNLEQLNLKAAKKQIEYREIFNN